MYAYVVYKYTAPQLLRNLCPSKKLSIWFYHRRIKACQQFFWQLQRFLCVFEFELHNFVRDSGAHMLIDDSFKRKTSMESLLTSIEQPTAVVSQNSSTNNVVIKLTIKILRLLPIAKAQRFYFSLFR